MVKSESVWAFLVASLVFVGPSPAQAAGDGGRAAFEEARELFSIGEFEVACKYFRQAVEESKRRPSTVFGLAQCERQLGNYDASIALFTEYLPNVKDDAERTQIKRTIKLLEEKKSLEPPPDETKADTPPKEPPVVPHPAPPPPALTEPNPVAEKSSEGGGVLASPVTWIVAGVVVVGGAIALGVALSGTESAYGGTLDEVLRP